MDALNWVLAGLKPMNSISATTDIRIKNHAAMDTLRRGDATRHEVDILIGAFNMCEGYVRLRPDLGFDWIDEIQAGQDALHAVGKRGLESGRFILKAQELAAMNLVMELHDAHAIARPQDRCLTNEPFFFCNVFDRLAINSASHDLVNIASILKVLY